MKTEDALAYPHMKLAMVNIIVIKILIVVNYWLFTLYPTIKSYKPSYILRQANLPHPTMLTARLKFYYIAKEPIIAKSKNLNLDQSVVLV